jgi:hypothetical protein
VGQSVHIHFGSGALTEPQLDQLCFSSRSPHALSRLIYCQFSFRLDHLLSQ